MKRVLALWLLLVANFAFGQEADLGIELAVRPSAILAMDQIGLLDVIITNYGPTEKVGAFSISGDFPAVNFGEMVSGQCSPAIIDPPPPGYPSFGVYNTPLLPVEDSETCTFPFQLDSSVPQSTVISMKVRPQPSQPEDPNQSNDIASVTLTFWDARPVPAIGPVALWILGVLILLSVGIRRHFLIKSIRG